MACTHALPSESVRDSVQFGILVITRTMRFAPVVSIAEVVTSSPRLDPAEVLAITVKAGIEKVTWECAPKVTEPEPVTVTATEKPASVEKVTDPPSADCGRSGPTTAPGDVCRTPTSRARAI